MKDRSDEVKVGSCVANFSNILKVPSFSLVPNLLVIDFFGVFHIVANNFGWAVFSNSNTSNLRPLSNGSEKAWARIRVYSELRFTNLLLRKASSIKMIEQTI